jgi:hypothetical protein
MSVAAHDEAENAGANQHLRTSGRVADSSRPDDWQAAGLSPGGQLRLWLNIHRESGGCG